MTDTTYRALVVREDDNAEFTMQVESRDLSELPEADLLIRVEYSSVNYKDALSASGNKGVTRTYPHTPGIDAAGVVEASTDERFAVGDRVIVIGYDLGMNTSGGYAEYIRVPAGWAVHLPEELSLWQAMALGTAGFTAAQSVLALQEQGIDPDRGQVLVSGATGGVGSIALALLAQLHYKAVAVNGSQDAGSYLRSLGADELVDRDQINDGSKKPLKRPLYAAAIDTVGGDMLAAMLKVVGYDGTVTTCGNAAGLALNTTVLPFILNGLRLIGIDSVQCPIARRAEIWEQLGTDWQLGPLLEGIATTIRLDDLPRVLPTLLEGKQNPGRYVVQIADRF